MKVLKYCPVWTEDIFLGARKLGPDFIESNGAVIGLVELRVNSFLPAFNCVTFI